MSGQSVNLTTLFLGMLRSPKRLTSTSNQCTCFRQKLTTALLESAEGETKECGRTRYQTRDLWLFSQMPLLTALCGLAVYHHIQVTKIPPPPPPPPSPQMFTGVSDMGFTAHQHKKAIIAPKMLKRNKSNMHKVINA